MHHKSLQDSARRVYNITAKEELARFTPHSIRVSACVLLSEAGKSHDFIQLRLRWRSQAFRDCLCNTQRLADLHASAADLEV